MRQMLLQPERHHKAPFTHLQQAAQCLQRPLRWIQLRQQGACSLGRAGIASFQSSPQCLQHRQGKCVTCAVLRSHHILSQHLQRRTEVLLQACHQGRLHWVAWAHASAVPCSPDAAWGA